MPKSSFGASRAPLRVGAVAGARLDSRQILPMVGLRSAPRGNRPAWGWLAGGLLSSLAACGGAEVTGTCPGVVGSADEVALTPRGEPNLEQLALMLAPEAVTTDTASYERVVADVAAIRALQPELADIAYRGRHDGKTIVLGLSDRGAQSFAAGKYSAWDCLNDFYGLVGTESYEVARSSTFVSLELKGIYNLEVLASLYGQLPEVESAEPSYGLGAGPTLCVQRDGGRYEYVVDRASGDCESGCIEHEAYLFASDSVGQVGAVDSWNSSDTSPRPSWLNAICR
jgi:hypothetical protein